MCEEKTKVLLVNDREENLMALEVTLSRLNLDLMKACSGREALRYCVNNDFAVVLLDVVMPEMDGFETALRLREHDRFRDTPIIFVTAYAKSEEELFRGYSLGAVDYIIAPYSPDVLRAKLARFVEQFRTNQLLKQQTEQLESTNKRLAQSLAEATELKTRLEVSNKQLDAFTYSVSHDLRAPLRTINGFSQALLEDYADKLDNQGKEHLHRIRTAAQRMGELIDDLLGLSRVTRAEMKRRKVDISSLAKTIIDELQRREPERQVEFVTSDRLTANGDEHLLRVMLENLLGNSWKFTAKRPKARIELGCTKDKGKAVYFMRDNGAGFDMKYADKLFIPFQRLHSVEEFPGTGIGLSIVQRIISRHGGRVWGEGVVNQGATFYFTLG